MGQYSINNIILIILFPIITNFYKERKKFITNLYKKDKKIKKL